MYFQYFVIISPWKRVWPFIWTNLNPIHPRMLCANFGWNWLMVLKIFKVCPCIFDILLSFPFEKGVALHLNKLKPPSPKDALCQVWLKLAQWFWRRKWKCEKFTSGQGIRWTDGRTDVWQTTEYQSFNLRWAKKKTYKLSQNSQIYIVFRSLVL